MSICPSCGFENAASAKFCSECATPLATPTPAREERKVVTVLFADLVGFTSRAEQLDPEEVRALQAPYWSRVRSEVERYGGTVEKFIGDAVMALFGAPTAHEDDPERAVRAALAIREWAQEEGELEVRIGITTGEALVSLGARPETGEGMASGDVVNTASRLQAVAPENGVLVDETTYRATQQVIEFGAADPVEAKGKADPVAVWEALEARSRFGVDTVQAGAPLVGRSRELDLLTDSLARSREEKRSQLVTLVGVPGIGKSRLVYELFQVVDADPELINWRQGRSIPYGDGVTYWALGEMVKAQAGILETDPTDEAEAKLREAVAALVPDEAEAGWVETWLRPLVGIETASDPGGDRRAESFSAWRRFFEALADHGPAVLVFEDLHWADDNLLDFVDYVVDWAADVPLLCVCTARPELLERRPAWGGGKPNASTISLSPLSDEETARLIGTLLERPLLAADQQAALLARAGGNPLYAEQFARMLVERPSDGELQLPETVQGIIAARLDSLPSEEKALLQDAAVLGKVFWAGALARMDGRERFEVEERLHALERKEFVRRERRPSVAGESEYAFRHLLVRDVAYGQIPRAARSGKHRSAAEWIESLGRMEDHAELLAHHYLQALEYARAAGAPPGALEERARLALRNAGDRALALSAFPAAARFYEAALELWPTDDPQRPYLLVEYARSRLEDIGFDESLIEEAVEGLLAADDRGAAGEAEVLLSFLWWHRGYNDRVLLHIEWAVQLVADEPPSRAKAFVLTHFSRFHMISGHNERAIEVGLEALAMAEELDLQDLKARNLNNIGVARANSGDPERGLADLDLAVHVAGEANSPEQWQAALNRAWTTAMRGDLARAWKLHLESTAIAERFGLEAQVTWERAERILYLYWHGEWDEVLRRVEEFLAGIGEGTHYSEPSCYGVRANVLFAQGEVERALEEAALAAELGRRARDPQALDPELAVYARILRESGDRNRVRAGAAADELLGMWEHGPHPSTAPVDLAWVLLDFERGGELERVLDRAATETRWYRAARLIVAGDLVGAADELERIGSVPDEAYARLRSGSEPEVRRALEFYRSVGATRYVQEGETILAATA